MKKIPTSFPLGSFTIKVVRLPSAEIVKRCGDVYGQFDPGALTIYLSKPDKNTKASIIYQTFWHEYGHALLWLVAPELYTKEKLADSMGHALAQIMLGATF
jgi:hypothetical protein